MPAVVAAAAVCASTSAEAGFLAPYRVLHSFCSTVNCGDGAYAIEMPALDTKGNLFGITYQGSRFEGGALYELTPAHEGKRYFKHTLEAFCDPNANCRAGYGPQSGLIMDTSGNLYGTTSDTPVATASTATACGSVYEVIAAPTPASHPQMKALHQFGKGDGCGPNYGSLDYQGKESGQLYDGVSPLYGMTSGGGANNAGAIYELTPPKPGREKWSERVVYSFCSIGGCADGANPRGNLVMDKNGFLFGGTSNGVIFGLLLDSGGLAYVIVHRSSTGENYRALALASDGLTLVGVADSGGATTYGTLFSISQNLGGGGARSAPQYTLLNDFCDGGGNCADGAGPNSVVLDAGGNIFGTTNAGGLNDGPPNSGNTGGGTIFEYTSDGDLIPLHQFCADTNCADGGTPQGGLMTDGSGNFYGTTSEGGSTANVATGAGVVYELSSPPG